MRDSWSRNLSAMPISAPVERILTASSIALFSSTRYASRAWYSSMASSQVFVNLPNNSLLWARDLTVLSKSCRRRSTLTFKEPICSFDVAMTCCVDSISLDFAFESFPKASFALFSSSMASFKSASMLSLSCLQMPNTSKRSLPLVPPERKEVKTSLLCATWLSSESLSDVSSPATMPRNTSATGDCKSMAWLPCWRLLIAFSRPLMLVRNESEDFVNAAESDSRWALASDNAVWASFKSLDCDFTVSDKLLMALLLSSNSPSNWGFFSS
mmetsp:Transcript_104715/g.293523  ORF Transcript_104715/g.293523 Transcript_104715/m.293523 type:complete len:270 (-) Transcript_104715:614-1423(-)